MVILQQTSHQIIIKTFGLVQDLGERIVMHGSSNAFGPYSCLSSFVVSINIQLSKKLVRIINGDFTNHFTEKPRACIILCSVYQALSQYLRGPGYEHYIPVCISLDLHVINRATKLWNKVCKFHCLLTGNNFLQGQSSCNPIGQLGHEYYKH